MEVGRCKKHTSHKYSKGVCPFCLREKLAQVTASSSSSNFSDSSAGDSPKHSDGHRRTNTLLQLLNGRNTEPLGRSRSMAFPVGEKYLPDKEQRKKRSGRRFWAKLMLSGGGRSKEEGEETGRLYHSKTIKEKPSSKWDLFSH